MSSIIEQTEQFVQKYMEVFDPSHDWLHVMRVRKNAREIAHDFLSNKRNGWEKIDAEIIDLCAMLHDVGDFKYTKDVTAPKKEIENFLGGVGYAREKIDKIVYIVENVSYRKEIEKREQMKIEILGDGVSVSLSPEEIEKKIDEAFLSLDPMLAIVQDADRLDSIGAIGVARCFAFGSARNRPLYDPATLPPRDTHTHTHTCAETYNQKIAQTKGDSLEHFYEKLYNIKKLMKTNKGRDMAEQRDKFLHVFVEQFRDEAGI